LQDGLAYRDNGSPDNKTGIGIIHKLKTEVMAENTFSLIFLFLFIGLFVIDSWAPTDIIPGEGSELHAYDRYSVAEQILAGKI
jgi:hypothetical protein